jgi:phage repressor protein C with HTH and peptisase S24 domain
MPVSEVTLRFMTCLDELIASGKVRSKRHFAITLDYHPQGISEMVAQRRDVPLDLLEKSVKHFQINASYLFTGAGAHFMDPATDQFQVKNLSIVTNEKGEERILHVPYPAQAGYGRLLDDPVFIQELPSFELPDPQFKSGTYRSFEIAGASMEPVFRSGDLVIASFIEPRYWEQAIKNGQIYVVVTQQDVVLKRLTNFLKTRKVIECLSDNDEYHPYSIDAEDIREVWKARVRITAHLDPSIISSSNQSITEQLQVQKQMLENLQRQLNQVASA